MASKCESALFMWLQSVKGTRVEFGLGGGEFLWIYDVQRKLSCVCVRLCGLKTQTDRQTDCQTDRQRQTGYIYIYMTCNVSCLVFGPALLAQNTDRQTDRLSDRQTDRQAIYIYMTCNVSCLVFASDSVG